MKIKRFSKVALVVLISLVLAAATFAYAAANTVPASNAGDGSGTVSGYTVTNVHYTLDPTNPANISNVAFTLNSAATSAQITLDGTHWFACTITGGTSVSCVTTGANEPTVLGAVNLRIVAAS
jgi:hypothetical protein